MFSAQLRRLIRGHRSASTRRLSVARTIVTASLIPLFALAAVPATASAALPPQGMYEGCPPSNQAQCDRELSQMGAAGFSLVLNYAAWYGSASDIKAYANEAQAAGIKVIWPLNAPIWRDPGSATTLASSYPQLAADCGCATNADLLSYVVALVRSLPSTWGYYIGDEVDPSQQPQVAALASTVRALDGSHPLLYVGEAFPDVIADLSPFEPIANVVGAVVYPIGDGGSAETVSEVAPTIQVLAQAAGAQPAIVLQAFSWAQYPGESDATDPRWPTETEMEAMRNYALASSPSMILWYSLYDVLRSDDPSGHWNDVVTAAFASEPAPPPPLPPPPPPPPPAPSPAPSPPGLSANAAPHRKAHRRHRRHHRHRHQRRHHAHAQRQHRR